MRTRGNTVCVCVCVVYIVCQGVGGCVWMEKDDVDGGGWVHAGSPFPWIQDADAATRALPTAPPYTPPVPHPSRQKC